MILIIQNGLLAFTNILRKHQSKILEEKNNEIIKYLINHRRMALSLSSILLEIRGILINNKSNKIKVLLRTLV